MGRRPLRAKSWLQPLVPMFTLISLNEAKKLVIYEQQNAIWQNICSSYGYPTRGGLFERFGQEPLPRDEMGRACSSIEKESEVMIALCIIHEIRGPSGRIGGHSITWVLSRGSIGLQRGDSINQSYDHQKRKTGGWGPKMALGLISRVVPPVIPSPSIEGWCCSGHSRPIPREKGLTTGAIVSHILSSTAPDVWGSDAMEFQNFREVPNVLAGWHRVPNDWKMPTHDNRLSPLMIFLSEVTREQPLARGNSAIHGRRKNFNYQGTTRSHIPISFARFLKNLSSWCLYLNYWIKIFKFSVQGELYSWYKCTVEIPTLTARFKSELSI